MCNDMYCLDILNASNCIYCLDILNISIMPRFKNIVFSFLKCCTDGNTELVLVHHLSRGRIRTLGVKKEPRSRSGSQERSCWKKWML